MMKHTMFALALVTMASTAALAGGEQAWTQVKDRKWTPLDPSDKAGKGPAASVVFGDMTKKEPIGFFLKLPAGGKPGPHSHTSDDYAVVIQGTVHNFKPGKDEGPGLTVGGQWFQPGGQVHDNHCEESSKDGCILFIYMPNGFDFIPDKAAAKTPAKK